MLSPPSIALGLFTFTTLQVTLYIASFLSEKDFRRLSPFRPMFGVASQDIGTYLLVLWSSITNLLSTPIATNLHFDRVYTVFSLGCQEKCEAKLELRNKD